MHPRAAATQHKAHERCVTEATDTHTCTRRIGPAAQEPSVDRWSTNSKYYYTNSNVKHRHSRHRPQAHTLQPQSYRAGLAIATTASHLGGLKGVGGAGGVWLLSRSPLSLLICVVPLNMYCCWYTLLVVGVFVLSRGPLPLARKKKKCLCPLIYIK